ncbi:MAG: sialidase family protein [Cyanobium sp.]|nr:sialidase family protein [Cyanobium sp.]
MTQLSRRALLRRAGLAAGLAAGGGLTGVLLQAAGTWLRSQPFRSGEGGYSCYRTPGLVITAAGTVLAFCGGRVDDCRDEGNIDVLLRRSTDGGRSWGPLQVIADDGPNPCKIPVPVLLPSGRILLLWMWNAAVRREADRGLRHLRVTSSDDDGRSWAPSRDITAQVRLAGWKPWSGIGPGHGIVKRLAPAAGRIVVPARHSMAGRGSRSHLLLSDDGGLRWRVGAIATGGASSECTVAELGDGSLMLNSRSSGGLRLVSISRDGGETMASSAPDPQLIEPVTGCQASLLTYAFGPERMATLLFANPVDRQHRTNGRLRLSRDNGRRWSRGLAIDPAAGAFSGYSDLARFADGTVGLLVESGEDFQKARGEEKRRNRRALAGRTDRRHDGIVFQRIPLALIAAG